MAARFFDRTTVENHIRRGGGPKRLADAPCDPLELFHPGLPRSCAPEHTVLSAVRKFWKKLLSGIFTTAHVLRAPQRVTLVMMVMVQRECRRRGICQGEPGLPQLAPFPFGTITFLTTIT